MQLLRCILFLASLVGARLKSRRGHALVVGLGVATGAAVFFAVLAGSLVARDRSLARALAGTPPSERAIRVAYFGVPPQGGDYGVLDSPVRRALEQFSRDAPIRAMQFGQTRIGERLVILAALDDVRRWIRVRSGRLPRSCSPSRCEVAQIGGSGQVAPGPGVRLVVVGQGRLRSRLPLGPLLESGAGDPTARYFFSQASAPYVVAEGVTDVSSLPALESIYRGYIWTVPVQPGSIHPWTVDDFGAEVQRVRASLEARSLLYDLTAPADALAAADETSEIAARRLLLIGGETAVLLLAFAVLGAASIRRDFDAAWQRLTWSGARRWQLVLAAFLEAAALSGLATLVGWALGMVAAAAIARKAGSPVSATLSHSVLSGQGLALALALATGATLVVLVSLRTQVVRFGGLALSPVDIAALGALLAVVVVFVRGQAGPRELALERGTGIALLLLPALVAFVAAVGSARLLTPALRLLERASRRAAVPVRLAAVSLARHPGRAAVATAFLVVSVGLALFATTYRATLLRGQDDQAAFAYPLDIVVREDLDVDKLVPPLQAAPLSRYRSLGADVNVVPTIRLRGNVSRLSGSEQLTVLGVPAGELASFRGWRPDFAHPSLAELARRLQPGRPVNLRGDRLPDTARELLLPLTVHGDDVAIGAAVLTRRGDFVSLAFGETTGRRSQLLRAAVPVRARGGQLVGLTLGLPRASQESREASKGILTMRPITARGPAGPPAVVTDYRDWVGLNGLKALQPGRLRYFVGGEVESLFRPRQPIGGRAVPVVTTPHLASAAGHDGVLPVRLASGQLRARIVGIAKRFPSIHGDFVLADEPFLFTALNADQPGSAFVNEIWLGAPSAGRAAAVTAALRRPPFDVLQVQTRANLAASLERDPLARGTLLTLTGAAVAALALAVAGLLTLIAGELREERGEFFDLEAQGASPGMLRRHLRLRALLLAVLGLLGGLLMGGVLAALVVDLVALTAGASEPQPPLVLALDWPLLLVVVAAYAAVAGAVAGAATLAAFRSSTPRSAGAAPE